MKHPRWLEYISIARSGLFDPGFYLLQYPDVRLADTDPLMHFIRWGWRERRNPSPNFDTGYYLEVNPDVREAAINPLWHYLRYGRKEGRSGLPRNVGRASGGLSRLSTELRRRPFTSRVRRAVFGAASAILRRLPAGLNQDVKRSVKKNIPLVVAEYRKAEQEAGSIYDDYRAAWRREALQDFYLRLTRQDGAGSRIKYLYCLPLFATGGAELVAINFIRLVLEKNPCDSALLLITDHNKMAFHVALPHRLFVLNLADVLGTSEWTKKKVFVYDVIRSLKPSIIHTINSSVLWQVLIEQGERIGKGCRIYGSMFCFQYDAYDHRSGYAPQYLRKALPYLNALFSDNQRFLTDAVEAYQLQSSADKFFTVYNPIYTPFGSVGAGTTAAAMERIARLRNGARQLSRMRLLWAGRLDEEQKHWKLVPELARALPDDEFDVFGEAVMERSPEVPELPNLHFHGGFKSFGDLLQEDHEAFILTSRFEGLPNILLEAGSSGIPIVAPSVGGVAELVTPETGYLLPEKATKDDYLAALDAIRSHPDEAASRAAKMLELLARRHTWAEFSRAVDDCRSYLNSAN